MKYLFLLVFLTGCNVEVKQDDQEYIVEVEKVLEFERKELPELTFNDSASYNGQIDYLNDNSWVFTSHTNDLCMDQLKSGCRKINALYQDEAATDRVVKIDFELMVAEVNLTDSPYWVIVYQDWVRIREDDANGNHPITTLKLKVWDGRLYLAHYDNSWQWDYKHPSDDIWDSLHNHQENTLNGFSEIELGLTYNVSILTYDSGRVIYKLNNSIVSDREYKTKSPTAQHAIQFGQYWDKGYNKEHDPLKRIVLRMDNFKVSYALNN